MIDAIRTDRLVLRPVHPDDAEAIRAQIADWDVMRWLSQPPWPYTLQDAVDFIGSCSPDDLTTTAFAITHAGAVIGVIDMRINPALLPLRGPGPHLGFWLGRAHWGNGYTTEAARGLLASAFAAGVGDTVYSGAFADNAASLRVQEKLGFVRNTETLVFARPRGREFPHVNTKLVKSAFRTA
ncbi:MAG: GNAT family N-acetyltransferase [Hyphomicrobiaceae bacterium]|nr:GNAT family N-acetyltransferase [Hyphomicrobiaceae bacterium]